jgi:transposase
LATVTAQSSARGVERAAPQAQAADFTAISRQDDDELDGSFGLSWRIWYVPQVRPRGEEIEEKDKSPDFKARRWIVEVCHSWFNRFRKLLVRYEKMDRGYLGLLMLAAAIIVLRKIKRQNQGNIIYG